MTKTNKLRIKLSVLALSLTTGTVFLDYYRKSGTVEAQVLGGMAEFVVGMFALIAVVGAIVYIMVDGE